MQKEIKKMEIRDEEVKDNCKKIAQVLQKTILIHKIMTEVRSFETLFDYFLSEIYQNLGARQINDKNSFFKEWLSFF